MPARPPRIPLARRMLGHKKGRLLLSVSGVCFAVIVMFMEIGFLSGFHDGQKNLLRRLRGELVILNNERETISGVGKTLSLARVNQVRQFPEVLDVIPIYEGTVTIKNPDSGLIRRVNIMAYPPNSDPIAIQGLEDGAASLRRSDMFLWDRLARNLFGDIKVGGVVEIAGRRMRVAGTYDLGANFTRDGCVVTGDGAWFTLGGVPDLVSMGLIRVQPGADVAALQEKMKRVLPADCRVFNIAALAAREDSYIGKETPVGVIFGSGLVIGFVIGVVICYQTLFNEVLDHLSQYATIRAMGFKDSYLMGVVLREAVYLGLIGYIPGVALSFVLYTFLSASSGFQMVLSPERLATVFLMTIPMCCLAGVLALRKALKVDPAEVF
jgi:putative ABC transport system permease protein